MKHTIIQITSGRGPAECCWVAAKVLKQLLKEATEFGLHYEIIHREAGEENRTLKSASIKLEGPGTEEFLKIGLELSNG